MPDEELNELIRRMEDEGASPEEIAAEVKKYEANKAAAEVDGDPKKVDGDSKEVDGDPKEVERPLGVPPNFVPADDGSGMWIHPIVKGERKQLAEEQRQKKETVRQEWEDKKSKYQGEDQSNEDFFKSIEPKIGRNLIVDGVPVNYDLSAHELGKALEKAESYTYITTGNGETVTSYGDPVRYEELKFLHDAHERAQRVRDRSAGDYSDLNDAELNLHYDWENTGVIKDGKSFIYQPNPDLQYDYEDHVNYMSGEMATRFGEYTAKELAPWKVAKDKTQQELYNRLSLPYYETIETDYADGLEALRDESTAARERINKAYIKKFDLEHPNGASQKEIDAATLELDGLVDTEVERLSKSLNEAINSDIDSKIKGNKEWNLFQHEYIQEYKAAIKNAEEKYSEDFKPTYDRFSEDQFNVIGKRLDSYGFAGASGPDKKILLESEIDAILSGLGGDVSNEDTLEIKNEFFSYFYDKLATDEEGRMTQFQAKDIAGQILEFVDENEAEYHVRRSDVAEANQGGGVFQGMSFGQLWKEMFRAGSGVAPNYTIDKYSPELKEIHDRLLEEAGLWNEDGSGNRFSYEQLQAIENQAVNEYRFQEGDSKAAYTQARKWAEDIMANPETIADMGNSELWAGITSMRFEQYVPFVGAGIEMFDSARIQRILDKDKEDRTPAETNLLAISSVKQQSDQLRNELSPLYAGGQIVGNMIPFVGEFVATGPLFRAAKTSAQVALRARLATRLSRTGHSTMSMVSKGGSRMLFTNLTPGVKLVDKSINALSTAFGLGAQNTGQWMRVADHMFDNMTDDYLFAFTTAADPLMEALSLDVISAKDDEGKAMGLEEGMDMPKALGVGFMQNYLELFTERLGMHLPGLGRKGLNLFKTGKGPLGDLVANADLFKRLSLGYGLRKLGLNTADDFYRWSRRNSGWDGFLGETTEELINMPLQNMLTGAPLGEGIFKYDTDGIRQGLDWEGSLKPLLIGLGVSAGGFGGGGAVISQFRKNKPPAYYVNNRKFTEWKAAKAYLNTLPKSLMNSSLDIEFKGKINYYAYEEAATILEKNNLKADQIKTPTLGVKGDKITAKEVEILDRLDSAEDRETLRNNDSKISELEEKKQEIKDSKKKKKQKGKEIAEIQAEISGLKKENSAIIDPVKQSIIEEKTKVQYQETLEKVREINKKYGKGKLIIGEPTKTAGEARSKARDILLAEEYGIEIVRTTKTNKSGSRTTTVTYKNIETGSEVTLSADALNEMENKLDEFQTAHGYIVPGSAEKVDKDGNVTQKARPSQMVINEEAAIAGRGENVAAHEYLHFFLQQTFKDNPEIAMATGRAFQRHLANIDPASIRDSEFRDRLTGYRSKGELVTAEESMTLFLDALSNGSMDYNESNMIKIGDIIRRLAQSLGFQVEFGEGREVHNFLKDFNDSIQRGDLSKGLIASMEGGIKIKGEILEQSKQIKENAQKDIEKFNEELKAIGIKKSITLEDLASVPGATYRFSKPKSAEQAKVDALGRNKDGSRMTNEQWDMEGSIIAYQELIENGKLIPLITKEMVFPVYGKSKESFIEDVMFGPSGGVAGTLFRFKPEEEIEETGKFGLSGWLNPQINLRKLDIMIKYEGEQTVSLDVPTGTESKQTHADFLEADPDANVQAFEEQDLSPGARETAAAEDVLQVAEKLNIDTKKVDQVLDVIFPVNKTTNTRSLPPTLSVNDFGDYKSLKPLIAGAATETRINPKTGEVILDKKGNPKRFKVTSVKTVQPTGAYFDLLDKIATEVYGISSKKILTDSDLTTTERGAAQNAIKERVQGHIDLVIPEGDTKSVTSTGAANTSFAPYYLGGGRGEFAAGATAAGKKAQTKRADITQNEILTDIGMREDGTFDSSSAAKSFDPMIRTHALMATVAVTNQVIRKANEEFGILPVKVAAKLGDGRSQIMFSKSSVPERLKEVYSDKYSDLIKAVSQSNPGSIKAVTRAVRSVFTKEDGFSDTNIKNLSQIIFARVRQYAKIVDSHRLTENEVIDFGKTLEEFLLEAKELETLDLGVQKALSSYLKANGKELPKDSNGKEIPLGNLFLDLDRIMRHRAMVPAIAESLINSGYSSLETAEIMIGYMKGMFAGLTKIGDGRYTVDADFNIVENPDWKVGDKNRKQTFDSTPDFINMLKSIPGLENITKVNPKTGKPSQGYYLDGKKIEATLLADNVDAFMKDAKNTDNAFEARSNQSNKAREYSEVILDVYYKELNKPGSNLDWADFGMILTTMGSGMESVLRKAAPAEYIMEGMEQVIAEGKAKGLSVGKIARYEHARPQAEIALKILHSYLDNGSLNPNVWDGYKVAIISAEMDGVMGELSLTSRSPLDGKPRYFNEQSFGDPRIKSLRSIDPKKKGTTEEFVGRDFVKAAEAIQAGNVETKNMQALSSAYRGIKLSKGKPKGISVLDFDDTLATTKSNVLFTAPDGTTGTLNAEEFAEQGGDLLAQGVKFDFSEFNKVVDGKTAPLFNKAMKLAGKFGTENMFVLTARAPESQLAIKQFLDAQGLKIPLKNITGLGKSEASAKANWIAEKVGEGYNDFYFADDAIQNVDAVREKLNELQVKNKVQQAKIKFSMNTKRDLNWESKSKTVFDLDAGRDVSVKGKTHTTKFKVGDNEYIIRLTNRSLDVPNPNDLAILREKSVKGDSVFDLEFALENQADELWEGAGKMGVEGTGRASEVLSIVSNGVMDFIKDNNVDAIGFSSGDTSRTRLYNTLTKFWASKLGWEWASESKTFLDLDQNIDVTGGSFMISNFNASKSIVEAPVANESNFSNRSTEERSVLNAFDVKGKGQRARIKFSKSGPKKMSDIIDEGELDFNTILEQSKGVGKNKTFSAAKARQRGKGKGRFKFFVPPSADDFAGLCYSFLGKGKQGDQHHAWFKENLFDPFSKGMRKHKITQQQVAGDMKNLRKAMPEVRKKLNKNVPGTEYTHEDAIRIHNWNKAGLDIPGLSKADEATLVNAVESDAQLQAFALGVNSISETPGGMVDPGPHWTGGNIALDLNEALEASRSTHLQQWVENKDVIFNEANMNKIEAVYGPNFREALEDSLWRMENGGTRSKGGGRLVNNFTSWIHGSIGTTMFLNARSAMLQMISNVNFVNWSDNNMFNASMAFANQPQYWKDVSMIFNSPFLKQRRSGIQTDVNAAELLAQVKDSKNKLKAATAYLLQFGFTPTQIADSFAIATGGATFYRNRINTYLKEGVTQAEAETKAFNDMMEIAEETQQSTREDKISQQQASPLGKFILAFQNTPMQYNRLIKKATQDLVNGRGDPKANISRIVYYAGIQNMIFYGLQQALFAALFSDDDEDEISDTKKERVVNGMIDTILRGSGIAGVAVSTLKNVVLKFMKESEKMDDGEYYTDPDWGNVVIEALNISPPIGIKARKIYSGLKTWEYNNDVIDQMDKTDIDNPIYDAVASVTEAVTNIPLSRLYNKVQNISESLDAEHETWKRVAMLLGWSKWSFGIKNQDVVAAKGEVKAIKAEEKVIKAEKNKIIKAEEKAVEDAIVIEENIEIQKEERKAVEEAPTEEKKKEAKEKVTCAAVNKSGSRCGSRPVGNGAYCTVHEKVEAREDGKKVQCSQIKADGKRCKMKTNNKSGKCYYHD